MSGLFKQYKTNADAEVNGVDYPAGSNEDGSQIVFIVARSGKNNMAYRQAFDKAAKPHRRAMAAGTLSDAVAEALLLDVFCGHVLKGWRNIIADEGMADVFGIEVGAELPYSKANAQKLMLALPDLYEELSNAASNMALYTDAVRENEAKN